MCGDYGATRFSFVTVYRWIKDHDFQSHDWNITDLNSFHRNAALELGQTVAANKSLKDQFDLFYIKIIQMH